MASNFPYISSDYFSQQFKPTDLDIVTKNYTTTESRHYRDEIEFALIIHGQGKVDINNILVDVSEGDLIQLMPYHVHRFVLTKSQQLIVIRIRCSIGLLLMTATNRMTYLKAIKRLDRQLPIIHLQSHAKKQLEFLCEGVMHEHQAALGVPLESLNIALIAFLSYIIEKYRHQAKPVQLNIGWRCLQYVQVHHQERDLTQANIAQELGISDSEVSGLIKGLTGYNFRQVLNQVRIRNATALLQFDELSVNQIARICGYRTQGNFYKQFEVIHHLSPNKYRQRRLGQREQNISLDAWSVVMVVLENCTTNMGLGELAENTHLSAKKVEMLLKDNFQTTFKQLRDQFRVQIAHTLLLTLPFSIDAVAAKVGFSDSNTFIRNFKRAYGVTPGNVKKS
jgi:AraC-like DNA-binding protein